MKIFGVLLFLFVWVSSIAGEKEINLKLVRATVYFQGAFLEHEGMVSLSKGESTMVFTKLSPYIDRNSISVRGKGAFEVVDVKFRMIKPELPGESTEITGHKTKIMELEQKIKNIDNDLDILEQQESFLNTNINIQKTNSAINPADFKQYLELYNEQFKKIEKARYQFKNEKTATNEEIESLRKKINELQKQVVKPTDYAEVVVTVEAENELSGEFLLSYYTANAGWYPTYDLRVDNVSSPARLVYKANVFQSTTFDWKNVKLTFSNAAVDNQNDVPVMDDYELSFNQVIIRGSRGYSNEKYNSGVRKVTGRVLDSESGEPIPFVNIMVEGSTVGTISDLDGNYSISIPNGAQALLVSFVGYESTRQIISSQRMDISLNISNLEVDEVVVTSYNVPLIGRKNKSETFASKPVKTTVTEQITNYEFKVSRPYSIESASDKRTIELNDVKLNAGYIYKAVPKINTSAFLVASITEWEQLNLLEGDVKLYFDNTYVGSSLLDLSYIEDTLDISLGMDRNISIQRVKEKSKSSRQLIGSNTIETRRWKTTIRNNRDEAVTIIVYDQIPVSKDEQIVVVAKNLSSGTLDERTGTVEWKIELKPKEKIEKLLEYEVKFPKSQTLKVE